VTTEIAILNRSAVALAADSAASVMTQSGIKVYDGVNKLFELVRGRPVGVMIYNSAELSFRPWETVIKTYREERSDQSFPTLDGYVDDFRTFVRDHKQLFSARQQQEAFQQRIAADLIGLRTHVARDFQAQVEQGGVPTPDDAVAIVSAIVRAHCERGDSHDALGGWAERLPSVDALVEQHHVEIDGVVGAVLKNLPMDQATRDKLRQWLIRRAFGYSPKDSQFSGVVFAGFGDDEYFPRLREFQAKALYGGHLLSRDIEESRTDIGVAVPGEIKSFAQGDMIRSFTDGVQDQVRGAMISYWDEWLDKGVGEAVVADPRLAHLGVGDLAVIRDAVNGRAVGAVKEFHLTMGKHEQFKVKGPLLQSVAHLPKDELGAMAESLVNLTTLKRRVSINQAQTVGGAVDVAVVSRGDGFCMVETQALLRPGTEPVVGANPLGCATGEQGGTSTMSDVAKDRAFRDLLEFYFPGDVLQVLQDVQIAESQAQDLTEAEVDAIIATLHMGTLR